MGSVLVASGEALRARREEILHGLGLTHEEFVNRAREYRLVGDEWDAWEELTEIDYLLDER
ncbi:MAG: hypothetical protein ACTHMZ_14250 [Actinomycetes bacterium]